MPFPAIVLGAGVGQFGWLTATQMMDGLGLAETTPGPLIMVVQFVGFMAGWNFHGIFSPLAGGIIGSLVASYFTFLPCFLFIFLGGPYIEKFRGNKKLTGALSSITAAVVGVVLNLAVWFGMHVLFGDPSGFNWFAAVVGLGSFIAIQWGRVMFYFRLLIIFAILSTIALWLDFWIRGELGIAEKFLAYAQGEWGRGVLIGGGMLYILLLSLPFVPGAELQSPAEPDGVFRGRDFW